MSWAAVVAGGAALVGSVVSSRASSRAGEAAGRGGDAAAAEAARQFDIIQANQRPYQQIGVGALNQLAALYGLPQYDDAQDDPSRTPGARNFQPSEVLQLLRQGYSIDDILKIGTMDPGQTTRSLRILGEAGLSTDDIQRLIQGRFSPVGGGQPSDLQGEIVGVDAGGNPIYGVAQGPETGVTPAAPDYSSFLNSPDYGFALEQGQQAVERGAAARGNLYSGNTLAETTRFGQGLATQNYSTYVNRLMGLAGIGQGATNELTGAGLATGANVGNALISAGNNRASGIIGSGNDLAGGIGAIGGGLYDWLSNRPGVSEFPTSRIPGRIPVGRGG